MHGVLKKKFKISSMVIHPFNAGVTRWNVLILTIIAVDTVLLPWQFAFLGVGNSPKQQAPVIYWFGCWADTCLLLDIALQFFLQVPSVDESHWLFKQESIMKRYVGRHLLYDLISIVPSEVLWYFFPANTEDQVLALVQFLRLFRLARVPRLLYRWKHDVGMTYNTKVIFKALGVVFILCHVMGCLWSTLAINQTGYTWLSFLRDGKLNTEFYIKDNVYVCALYWAVFTITGIGYGDIVPVTQPEYLMAITCMVSGSLLWAWVVASIVSVITNINESKAQHQQTMDELHMLVLEHQIDQRLSRRLQEYFMKVTDLTKVSYVAELVHRLSPTLRHEVIMVIHGKWIQKVWWLNNVPGDFIVAMVMHLTPVLHTPNEFIPNSRELCVIHRGLAIHGGILKEQGQIFGEDMLLHNEALRKNWATLALTFLHLYVMSWHTFSNLCQEHPYVQKPIKRAHTCLALIRGMLLKAKNEKEHRRHYGNQGSKLGKLRAVGSQEFAVGDAVNEMGTLGDRHAEAFESEESTESLANYLFESQERIRAQGDRLEKVLETFAAQLQPIIGRDAYAEVATHEQ